MSHDWLRAFPPSTANGGWRNLYHGQDPFIGGEADEDHPNSPLSDSELGIRGDPKGSVIIRSFHLPGDLRAFAEGVPL